MTLQQEASGDQRNAFIRDAQNAYGQMSPEEWAAWVMPLLMHLSHKDLCIIAARGLAKDF